MGRQEQRYRRIAELDLARFPAPEIPGNRGLAWRAAWYAVSALFFQSALLALIPNGAKAAILRGFGARVGRGLVMKPRVTVKYPWFLEIGAHVWIGEGAWIDNHTRVRIGSNVCVSQGAYIFTGNHDWNDPTFRFFCRPVEIGDGAWITAFQRIPPGAVIPPSVAVVDARPETGAAGEARASQAEG